MGEPQEATSMDHASSLKKDRERKLTVAEGVRFHTLAECEQVRADLMADRDWIGSRFCRKDAEEMQGKADSALTISGTDEVTVGNGGEIVSRELAWEASRPGIYDHLTEAPEYLRAQAALDRLEHAPNGTLTTAVEAATSIDAKNSLERMLCYQLASAHHTSQRLAKLADRFAGEAERGLSHGGNMAGVQALALEAARCANAQARTMEAYQKGMLVLERVRNGGKQHVTVQHVNVQDGGKAMVAGMVRGDRVAKDDTDAG